MPKLDYGYLTSPTNELGLMRARTLLGNLRMWDIPRSKHALDTVIDEIGRSPIPGLYVLLDEQNEKMYIGQTQSLKRRLTRCLNESEGKNWDRAIIITDGRIARQSDLNDKSIRLMLKNYLVIFFKPRCTVITPSDHTPSLSSTQAILCNAFRHELIVLLTNTNLLGRMVTECVDGANSVDLTQHAARNYPEQ